ncbi:MAG TPA: hypothetical protein VD973_24280, partial [Symbiobacteriaceae bacterium]|nr:hypothetical protein [Symbiobacteriaceae bacterium]
GWSWSGARVELEWSAGGGGVEPGWSWSGARVELEWSPGGGGVARGWSRSGAPVEPEWRSGGGGVARGWTARAQRSGTTGPGHRLEECGRIMQKIINS